MRFSQLKNISKLITKNLGNIIFNEKKMVLKEIGKLQKKLTPNHILFFLSLVV